MKRLEETPKKIVKILYVESGVDEKAGAEMLEQSTASLSSAMSVVCAFTVVNNAFIGIECTEHTCYDAVIIQRELKTLGALEMMRVLKNVGAPMPFILLLNPEDGMTNDEALSEGFFCALRKPYTTSALCAVVRRALETNPSLLAGTSSASVLASRGAVGGQEVRAFATHASFGAVASGGSSASFSLSSTSSSAPSGATRIFRPIPNKRAPPLHNQSYETEKTSIQSSVAHVRSHVVRDAAQQQQEDSRIGIRTSRVVGASHQHTMRSDAHINTDIADLPTTFSTRDTIGTIDTDIVFENVSSTTNQFLGQNWTEMFSEDDLHHFRKFVKQKREYEQWKKQKIAADQASFSEQVVGDGVLARQFLLETAEAEESLHSTYDSSFSPQTTVTVCSTPSGPLQSSDQVSYMRLGETESPKDDVHLRSAYNVASLPMFKETTSESILLRNFPQPSHQQTPMVSADSISNTIGQHSSQPLGGLFKRKMGEALVTSSPTSPFKRPTSRTTTLATAAKATFVPFPINGHTDATTTSSNDKSICSSDDDSINVDNEGVAMSSDSHGNHGKAVLCEEKRPSPLSSSLSSSLSLFGDKNHCNLPTENDNGTVDVKAGSIDIKTAPLPAKQKKKK